MGIGAYNNRNLLLLTEFQHLPIIFIAIQTAVFFDQRTVVDFQSDPVLFGS